MEEYNLKKYTILITVFILFFVSLIGSIQIDRETDDKGIIDIKTKGGREVFYGNSVDEEWNKTFGGLEWDIGCSIQKTNDGGYIFVGYTESYGNGDDDIWLIKTDYYGNEEWNRTFGGYSQDKGYSVLLTTDNSYVLVGHTWSYGSGSCDVWLIKTDEFGNEEWNKTYGGVEADGGKPLKK